MRRVARDGSSHYFINQSACRLTDVVELHGRRWASGKELHSIIGQGKVESLPGRQAGGPPQPDRGGRGPRRLQAPPRARRAQAARGAAQPRARRATSSARSASQLAPLRRQANAAEQLRTVEREIAETRGRLLTGELEAVDARLAASRAAIEQVAVEQGARPTLGWPRIETDAAGRRGDLHARLAEREQRAARPLRARYLADRLASTRRLTEQRLQLPARWNAPRRPNAKG